MARNPPSVDASVATTRELLNAALARSARRNARVANLRIAFRWVTWAIGQALKYTSIALAVAIPIALGWHAWQQRDTPDPQPPVLSGTPTAPATQASAAAARAPGRAPLDDRADAIGATPRAASAPAVKPAPDGPRLRLRLDDSVTP